MPSRFDNYSEEELIAKLDAGFNGESELAEIIAAMEKKGMKGGLIGFDDANPVTEKITTEYIKLHNDLDSDKPTRARITREIGVLKRKKPTLKAIKMALLTLAHAGTLEALDNLKNYAKVAKGELLLWTKMATSECKMFLEADLLDRPKIKVEKYSQVSSKELPSVSKISRLLDYFFSDEEQAKRAISDFFDGETGPNGEIFFSNEQDEALLMDWLVFDYKFPNGQKLIEQFINNNPLKLTKQELATFEEMIYNKYGLYEVKKIKLSQWIELESIASGKIYRINEKLGTYGSTVDHLLICRVGQENGKWRMIGSDPIELPVRLTDEAKKIFSGSSEPLTPKDVRRFV